MLEQIEIKNLRDLKITKVKPWKIYFTYDNIKYMIINDGAPGDPHISLYKREFSENNKCNLHYMNGVMSCNLVIEAIKDISKNNKHGVLVYSNIDREYFVKRLVEYGFSTGLYFGEYNKAKYEKEQLYIRIKRIQEEINAINSEWRETFGHGSKCYGIEHKLAVMDRVKAKQLGEYCEEYNDYYGNTHPKYGGTLIDLYSLSFGKCFIVNNGDYYASIDVDKHGDKCISTSESFVKLTREHHSAYITLLN